MDANKGEARRKAWKHARRYTPEILALASKALADVRLGRDLTQVLHRYHLPEGGYLGKHHLVAAYRQQVENGECEPDPKLLERIRMKPMRTQSGVTTVTVLTKPYPCPGKCIFCPTDVRMPKSYLPDEPGARRGLEHNFEPFEQTQARLKALDAVGHPTDKVELLILGGTWSSYRRDYQEWFIRRCFDALNGIESASIEAAQQCNETAPHRNVGLVIETRPDHVSPEELTWLRGLGVTKVQIGVQSLDDRILALNQRGHTAEETRQAAALLRAFGFKTVMHWMPNLLGATPESDRADFARLWEGLCPDEIKIYPNQLLANAELYSYWQRGEFLPYTTETLVDLIASIKPAIPRYCRVNRVIRDIPSNNVVEGNRKTSLRQDVHAELARRGERCLCVRCREVRAQVIEHESLQMNDLVYQAGGAEEHFLSFDTPADRLAGFLRLSLPGADSPALGQCFPDPGLADLQDAAIVREVHVYGQSLEVGAARRGAAQHAGLGTGLLEHAAALARQKGYRRLAVIAAAGTRQYYLERGFARGDLYLVRSLL